MKQAITGSKLFNGIDFIEHKALLIDDQHIAGIVNEDAIPTDFQVKKLEGGILSPGFIDLQVNGGGGKLFNNSPDKESLNTIISAHQYFGTTSIMPTVISDSLNILQKCTDTISNEINNNHSLLGIHIEGPFFNVKYRGVHQKQYINTINASYLNLFETLDKFPVMLTLAPECISIKQLKHLKSLGFKILAGHTDANYDQLEEAVKYGLDGFTHLFNAMGQISAREPGVVGSAFDFDETSASIIVDLHHVHPSLINLSFKQKPKGKLFFVSDSMATINHGEPSFELYDEVVSESNGRIINSEGKLAGSSITQIDAIKNAYQKCSIPLESAISMATLYPAEYLGVSDYIGQLKKGYRADLAHFDSNFHVQNVWLAGKQIKEDPQ
ncbi:N-acetylhexosamine 6-phosphate deacetylase [Candidatus Pseudothioglobus singularis]|jgi:N-acetylglucosamine-6-phosphate deacetylase|uniref:N-acetylglucosamine-6-phosphate deacetylase n=1 Tax=Candidatus Pseudothioglobus singularis TaxID=1427364 RepID=UPI00080613AF|nr:N-acetylglucosamine-6-phosphate deacetylase [Candidatus Pseudothioglobus singularis]ANQ67163.1 N-acetylhexosamine 6-phosphate deacetylase [Candidatus Pseudothioglobus singularis]MDP0595734.1 N-acetylglucosamine-6-phosphate deacetylase [Candidatus Thioglobus sp.]